VKNTKWALKVFSCQMLDVKVVLAASFRNTLRHSEAFNPVPPPPMIQLCWPFFQVL
jgi:hypothetical protein